MRTPTSISPHHMHGSLVARALGAAALLALSITEPAHAQIGALAKKAAAKAAAKTATQAGERAVAISGVTAESPSFDEQLLELNETRLDDMIAGLKAARAVTAPGGATRAQLVARAQDANEQRSTLFARHDADQQRLQEEERRVSLCRGHFLDSLDHAHNEAMEKKAAALARSADPMATRLMQEVMQASKESQRLLAAGDSSGAIEVQRALARRQGIDPAADSAHATTRCGAAPAAPRWQQESDSLVMEAQVAMRLAQTLDEQAAQAGAGAAGMSARQYALALERLIAYVGASGTPSSAWRFSVQERKVLFPRLSQLKALL